MCLPAKCKAKARGCKRAEEVWCGVRQPSPPACLLPNKSLQKVLKNRGVRKRSSSLVPGCRDCCSPSSLSLSPCPQGGPAMPREKGRWREEEGEDLKRRGGWAGSGRQVKEERGCPRATAQNEPCQNATTPGHAIKQEVQCQGVMPSSEVGRNWGADFCMDDEIAFRPKSCLQVAHKCAFFNACLVLRTQSFFTPRDHRESSPA